MSRRGPYASQEWRCAVAGCGETQRHTYDDARSYRQNWPTHQRAYANWRCERHAHPERILTPSNITTTATMTVEGQEIGRFWDGKHGLVNGPGFVAYAREFPPGTRIVVTTRIEMPATPPRAGEGGSDG